MLFVRRNVSVLIITVSVLVTAAPASAQVCEVSADGSACTPLACSTIPEDRCIATTVHIDWATGAITALTCDCMNFNFCHVEFGNATPHAVGGCPEGGTCEVMGSDTDNDGIHDTFTAACLPAGVCCLDIDDGPVPFDTCVDLGEDACYANGGIFHPSDATCDEVQACCMAFAGAEFCTDLAPWCCIYSGGVPLGRNTSCADTVCPPICGGFVGIPCEDPNTFCQYPDGTCNAADLFGVCIAVPNGCPDVWDPVCGCDGVTYGNECEAEAARMSIDHYGACEPFCRPLDDGSACAPMACGLIPEDQCLPMVIHMDIATGAMTVLACDCVDFNLCHLEFGNAAPLPVGMCLNGGVCTAVGADTNGDGIDDLFEAACVPTGGCCSDMSGSPLPLPVCTETTEDNCPGPNAHFKGPGTTCDPTEACCMPLGGEPYCVDTDPFCCLAFGGVPQGPGTTCADGGCGQRCGGPNGLPCDTTTSFCKFPEGSCGEDNEYGVCTVRPVGCPDVWDPVCSCDGMTYGNECEADAVGVSVRHHGECARTCGGLGPMPHCLDDEFCKYPEGTCGVFYLLGICTPIPTGGCPENYDPVCACNGVTYGNECEADAAGVSLLHHGACEWTCCDPNTVPPCPVEPICCGNGYWACPEDPTVPTCPDGPGVVCGPVCGGFIGIPCESFDVFCKHPDGTCNWADHYGMCTHIPTGGCPEYYDPVCGCDGVTYDNQCFADAAAVSIAHHGPCDQCNATRFFTNATDADSTYCPGVEKVVHIALDVPAGTDAVALEDVPPAGWLVTFISHDGTFDYVNGKVKWGPFFAPNIPQAVHYVVIPSDDGSIVSCFEGTVSLDGLNQVICGEACLIRHCRQAMDADTPQPPCAMCPGGDCSTCSDHGCQDGQVSLCELITYACAWKAGCNDDMAGMARAAFVWRNGECYCWDEAGQNWFPTTCPAPPSGACGSPLAANPIPGEGTAMFDWRTSTPSGESATRGGRSGLRREVTVSVSIVAPPGTTAMALDMEIPRGWQVKASSDDGDWDATHRKIKWGPFFDDLTRTITFKLGATASKGTVSPRSELATKPRLDGLTGTVSFDGVNEPITAK